MMEAKVTKLLDFLKSSQRFSIPIFQRTYSWTEQQCRQLWDDIVRTGEHDEVLGHFIGSIMYVVENDKTTQKSPFLIIDGQQRLTTVSLLLEAIARRLNEKGSVNGFTSDEIRDDYLLRSIDGVERLPKLTLTQTDNNSLFSVLNQKPWPREHSTQLRESFDFFEKEISTLGEDLSTICKGLDKLTIVDVALTRNQDNPQLIFESMNSTGKELSQSDLIRNFILMGSDSETQALHYRDYWRPMEEMFGQDAYRADFDSFIRHYLTAKTCEIPKVDDVYEAFKTYSRTPEIIQTGMRTFLQDIKNHAKYFCDMTLGGEEDTELRYAFEDLRELGVDVIYPFLLVLYHDYANNKLSKSDFHTALRIVESYIFRRAVCGIPSNSHGTLFATFSRSLNKDKYLESIKAHFMLLPSYRKMPSNEEFINDLKIRNLYNFRIPGYWLRRLENHDRKERAELDDYTIEHILPQNENLSPEWRKSLGENWKLIQETWLHTLGNLTLTGYNSEYSDRPFHEKRDMKGGFRESPLRLNAGIGALEKWDEDAIKDRADNLAEIAIEVWSYPKLQPEILTEYQPEKKQESGPDIDDLEYLARGRQMRPVFDEFHRKVMALSPDVTHKVYWGGIIYKTVKDFVSVQPMATKLRIDVNLRFDEVNDPEGLCRDVTDIRHWGYGDVQISISSLGELPYVMTLVQQAFDKQNPGREKTPRQVIPEETLSRLREIIEKAHWIFAVTYAKTAPHEYCLREDKNRGNVPAADMLLFAKCIWEYGYRERYKSYMQTYLDIDDHKYWSMDPSPEATDLINRAPKVMSGEPLITGD